MLYATVRFLDKKIMIQPVNACEELSTIKLRIPHNSHYLGRYISKRIVRKLRKKHIQNIVLCNQLQDIPEVKENLLKNSTFIITGSRMFKTLLPTMLEDVCSKMRYPKEKLKLLLLVNEYSIETVELIKILSHDFKQLTVISKQQKKYHRIVSNLFYEYGYIVKMYSPEEYAISKERFVINIDFSDEEMQSISLLKNTVYISFHHPLKNKPEKWQGISILDIDVKGISEKEFEGCQLAICEAQSFHSLKSLEENTKSFFECGYYIGGYFGEKGKIPVEEIEKLGKNFT